jgi:hypothetical protein
VLNEVGQVAFVADLTGPGVTSDNNTALYAGLPGQLVEVVREGNVIDVDPGIGVSNRTVNSVDFLLTSGAENGRGIAFNDNGLLVYRLGFTDGSRGIFTSQIVPEPSIILLTGLSLMGLGFLARRKSYERH